MLSMGMQQFANPKGMVALRGKDPEMFSLMAGVMKTPMGDLEQNRVFNVTKQAEADRAEAKKAKAFYSDVGKKSRGIEKKIEGSIYAIEAYRTNYRVKKPNAFMVKLQVASGEWRFVTVFRSIKETRIFLYLFTSIAESEGRNEAYHKAAAIQQSIRMRQIPSDFSSKDAKWDIKDPSLANLPRAKEA